MAFVLLLILSISTLVQVQIASSASGVARLEARQAALLSLNFAIGKLQETAGLDQRVTAPAASVAGISGDENGPKQLTGVWRSWEGLDHDKSTGLPKQPSYDSKMDTGVLDIDSTSPERFLGWLVSSAYDPDSSDYLAGADAPPSLINKTSTVPLLASGSVIPNPDPIDDDESEDVEVYVVPTEIDDGAVAIAWWIQGENTKALMREANDVDTSIEPWVERAGRLSSAARPDEATFKITDSTEVGRVSSRQSINSLENSIPNNSTVSQTYFHDVTGYSRGLLTNTANGGWRRDLSLMTEQWANLANSGLPFFTLEPGLETSAVKNSSAVGGLIYPWAQEINFPNPQNQKYNLFGGASVGWGALVDFSTQYQKIVSGVSDTVTFNQYATTETRDEINLLPVLARIHWVFSFNSKEVNTAEGDYRAVLNMDAVITYWNPYNVALSASSGDFWLQVQDSIPYQFEFTVGSNSIGPKTLNEYAGGNNFSFEFPADTEDWQPGETRVYSIDKKPETAGSVYTMKLGYDGSGHDRNLDLYGSLGDSFTVLLTPLTSTNGFNFWEWNGSRIGSSLNVNYELDYTDAESYWGDSVANNTLYKIGDLASPFMIEMIQLQVLDETTIAARGSSHKRPIQNIINNKQSILNPSQELDAFPFDVVMQYPNAGTGSLPNYPVDASDPYGAIGTSYTASGLKNLIVAEIPTRPLRSLGELQHFDLNANNPAPPYVANPIGNSNASHLIEADEVFIAGSGASVSQRHSYDHSYIGNHLFFDDWFVSSIAPETNGYSSSEIRSTEKVYRDFLSGDEALPNQFYRPAKSLSSAEVTAAVSELSGANSMVWHDVASQLEVDGMFNVNSTSVEAWTALLKHLSDVEVPYVSDAGDIQLDTQSGNPVSRTTIAGHSGGAAIGKHVRLTDLQVKALATEIVNQVKKRGPFLSLSEFVNRKLSSSETELALSGAVEAALAELSTRGATENPFASLQALGQAIKPTGSSNVFSEAAVGDLAYGFPGWVRQADVLRPLVPVLSARDDTFVIRAYGETKDPITGETTAGAWCEAIVQRRADYVDSDADDATVLPSKSTLSSEANERFGRRFTIVSFRWLSPDEV
jgi:hypothetical protein